MNVSGVNSSQQSSSGALKKQSTDPVIKEAQDKIEELKEKIKALSDDDTLDARTKAEQKKEMQEQISELNMQIRQRQAELRKQEYESKKAKEGATEATAYKGNGDIFSVKGTNALLSAQNSISISNDLGELAYGMEITARRLSKEIMKDVERGADTSAKENMLADLKEGIVNTRHNQVEFALEANLAMSSAGDSEEEEEVEGAEEEKSDVENTEGEIGGTGNDGIKIEGIYDKDGNLTAESGTDSEYEDRA